MRLYFTEFAAAATFGARPLQILSVGGAIVVGVILRILSGTPVWRIAAWCVVIAAAESGIAVVNRLFMRRQPSDDELQTWAIAKMALAGVGGLAWSLGPALLHVSGQPLTTMVPVWTILMYCCGAVWAGAFYAPALYTMIVTATLPAALWLLPLKGIEEASGFCLLFAIPFFMAIGQQAALRYRAAVNDKLEIEQLLERQNAYTRHIEQLSAERTRFFSAASHDLRQPLHAMGLYLSLLRDNPRGADRDELIENLSQCAFSLDTQFNAILGVNEMEELLEQARPVATPMQDVFDHVAVQARPKAIVAGLELRVRKTREWAMVAPDVLERVLGNLVSNALRYTHAGGVLVGVRRRGDQLSIHVVDTGIGIAPDHQKDVFNDFFQVGNPERNREHGFGLGLGIVRRLCEGMGWRIEMKSQLGRGTNFVISVPSAPAAIVSMRPAVVASKPPPLLQRRTALVVDDDEHVRDAMGRMLARWGVRTEFCKTADEALAILSASDPSTNWHLLADYRLAGETNGLVLAQEAVRLYGDRAMPAIITGEADENLESEAGARGIVILRKPVQPVRLRALLAR